MGREIFVYARVDAHAHHELGGKNRYICKTRDANNIKRKTDQSFDRLPFSILDKRQNERIENSFLNKSANERGCLAIL